LNKIIVSIDGPSGSGKERISKYISKKYNFYHLDSGILYRRLSNLLLKNEIDINNKKALSQFLKSIKTISHRKHRILRRENISKNTSNIATITLVRKYINNIQKKIVSKILKSNKGCVIDGRDIGSHVFKNAKIKLYIQVRPEIRAKRRHKQLIERGEKSIYSRILKDINLRDKTDKSRSASPLVVPKGAIIINNSFSFKNTILQINAALNRL
tara:strand:+ start:828 stop:1466 length:639 start_codon:yes stop_codon:yes gene_type:complete